MSYWARLVVCLALLGWVAGCHPPQPPIRVGVLVWPPYELLFLARSQGHFSDQTIELVEYRSPIDVARGYETGGLDAILLTADFALRIAERNVDSRLVLVVDYSNGADVIVARPGIETVEDLRGRPVGVELSSLGLYLLQRALALSGMTLDDVDVVSIDYPELAVAYEAGRIDAAVVYDPQRSRLLEQGARQIFDSSQIPGEIVDVLLVREHLLETRTQDLRRLVDAWFRALDSLHSDPQQVASIMISRLELNEQELLESLTQVVIPDRQTNLELLSGSDPSLSAGLQQLGETMQSLGLLRSPPALDVLLDDRLVTEASE